MPLWQFALLFGAVFLGGAAAFFLKKGQRALLPIVLSFSGAYILGIAVLHLMPWVFSSGNPEAGLFVLAGFFVQLLLEQLSAGVEHGHIHAPHHFSAGFVVSVMVGLCVHAFVEGIPLSYYEDIHAAESPITNHPSHSHNHLLYGIILHHIPAAFALVVLLTVSQVKKPLVWLCLLIFAAMSPAGAGVAGTTVIFPAIQTSITAFVIGSLLHISTVILFEMDSSSHHYISWKKLAAIAAGLGIAVLTLA